MLSKREVCKGQTHEQGGVYASCDSARDNVMNTLRNNAVPKGQVSSSLEDAVARLMAPREVSMLKSKGRLQEDVVVFVTESMGNGRMKLPARMFNGKSVMYIDGTKINSQPNDRGRSDKLNPSDYFNADPGDTITFTHLGGNKWDYETAEGTKADKKAARNDGRASNEPPKKVNRNITRSRETLRQEKAAKKAQPKARNNGKLTRTEKAVKAVKDAGMTLSQAPKALKSFIGRYAEMAIDNHDENPKFRNMNIVGTNTKAQYGLEQDARELLTPKQSGRFRRERKRLFEDVSLEQMIRLLNEAVYE